MTELELSARLLLSIFFGTLVGIERQWHHKTAGLKTNSLVALGATAITIIAQLGFANPSQVAAGVVTGIGFIGAGVIIRHGGSVQGVNSAATLWITASIGMALGIGQYRMACLLLVIVQVSQFLLRRLAMRIDNRSGLIATVTWRISVEAGAAAIDQVRAQWNEFATQSGVEVISYHEANNEAGERSLEVLFGLPTDRSQQITLLGQTLAALSGVSKAEWSRADSEREE